jgi:hypothetical protein
LLLADGLVPSIIMASLLLVYNAAVTSVFAEPDFRYREMVDLPVILIAGLGLTTIPYWTSIAFSPHRAAILATRLSHAVLSSCARDVWLRFKAMQLAMFVVGVAIAGFASWTLFMLKNTLA